MGETQQSDVCVGGCSLLAWGMVTVLLDEVLFWGGGGCIGAGQRPGILSGVGSHSIRLHEWVVWCGGWLEWFFDIENYTFLLHKAFVICVDPAPYSDSAPCMSDVVCLQDMGFSLFD